METGKMRNSVSMVLLMLMSTFAAIDIPEAEASEVVLTDAIQIVNGGSANDRMVATDADTSFGVGIPNTCGIRCMTLEVIS